MIWFYKWKKYVDMKKRKRKERYIKEMERIQKEKEEEEEALVKMVGGLNLIIIKEEAYNYY